MSCSEGARPVTGEVYGPRLASGALCVQEVAAVYHENMRSTNTNTMSIRSTQSPWANSSAQRVWA
eukprot:1189603-Lingulodinium_polyedra.AAC.1